MSAFGGKADIPDQLFQCLLMTKVDIRNLSLPLPATRFLCARWKREIGALQSFGGSDAYVSHDLHGLNHRDV